MVKIRVSADARQAAGELAASARQVEQLGDSGKVADARLQALVLHFIFEPPGYSQCQKQE